MAKGRRVLLGYHRVTTGHPHQIDGLRKDAKCDILWPQVGEWGRASTAAIGIVAIHQEEMGMSSQGRRLPVYLVLDTSGSMSGEPIEAVRQGIKALLADLRGDPQALETAFLSVITFSSGAQQVCPLTELMAFQEPALDANGSTALGAGLDLLEQCISREVRKGSTTQKGDWKPLVFLMTDGQPTDSWEGPATRIKQARIGNIIACAAGAQADEAPLKRLSETVVKLSTLQPEALKQFFKWVSSPIKMTSQSINQPTAGGAVNLPPAPPGVIQIVP